MNLIELMADYFPILTGASIRWHGLRHIHGDWWRKFAWIKKTLNHKSQVSAAIYEGVHKTRSLKLSEKLQSYFPIPLLKSFDFIHHF